MQYDANTNECNMIQTQTNTNDNECSMMQTRMNAIRYKHEWMQ